MITDYLILSSNDELVTEIIDFFTSQETNPDLFNEIKDVCIDHSKKFRKADSEMYINMGFLSGFDFLMYMSHTKKIGNGIKTRFVEIALQQLVKNYILTPLDSLVVYNQDQRYKVAGKYAKVMYQQKLIKNLLYGFNYIIDCYRNSVVKIEHVNHNDDTSIGTGFLITSNSEYIIVTNKHVVENAKKIRVLTYDEQEIKVKSIFKDNERDLALVFIEYYDAIPFVLNVDLDVMKEIITIGYPKIPTTKYAYQVYHKGEVNSFVEDYWNHKLFLISAKTSSGNSGSPIVDHAGRVVGVITEELFEKDMLFEKGKLPYYAGIPVIEILKSIEKSNN